MRMGNKKNKYLFSLSAKDYEKIKILACSLLPLKQYSYLSLLPEKNVRKKGNVYYVCISVKSISNES